MTSRLVVTQIAIVQPGESPVFGENTVTVSLDDEGGGAFVVISNAEQSGAVRLDFSEADLLCEAIERLKKEAAEE